MKKKLISSKDRRFPVDFAQSRLMESLDKEGKDWEILVIEEGDSLNNRSYPAEVLKKALHLFEDVKCCAYEFGENFFNHLPGKVRDTFKQGFVKNVVGIIDNVKFKEFTDENGKTKEGVFASFHIFESASWLRKMLTDAWNRGKKKLLGFSIDGGGPTHRGANSKDIVDEIKVVDELTLVTSPAAGGSLQRLVASIQGGREMDKILKMILESLKKSSPDLVEGLDNTEKLTDDQEFEVIKAFVEDFSEGTVKEFGEQVGAALSAIYDRLIGLVKGDKKEEALKMLTDLRDKAKKYGVKPGESKESVEDKKKREVKEAKEKEERMTKEEKEAEAKKVKEAKDKRIKEAVEKGEEADRLLESIKKTEEETSKRNCKAILEEKLKEASLPKPVVESLRKRFDDKMFKTEELDEAIREQKEIMAKLAEEKAFVPSNVEVGDEKKDKLGKAMDGFFEGENVDKIPKFSGFQEAYEKITGDKGADGETILAACHGFKLEPSHRLTEAIATTTFAQILGDSITRKMVKEYLLPALNDWRKIVSDIVPIKDFRTNRRTLFGGYGNLPAVNQAGDYQELSSPGDDENTYAISKKGGLERITMETIANDDVGLIRRIPKALGQAAAQTLYDAIFDIFVDNAATTYDGVVLFHAVSHSNLGSTALSDAALSAIRVAMKQQRPYGDSAKRLGKANLPKFILHPPELDDEVYKLLTSKIFVGSTERETSPNIHSTYGIEGISIDDWADATDFVVVADPKKMPTIEVGFYKGKEEPEMFVQDMPNVGSMFDSDQIKYKIRHIWGIVLLDYTPFYKNEVAGS